MGKTLTFWILLLFRPNGIQIIVTPLNQLGRQQVEGLERAGMHAIAIDAASTNEKNFKVRTTHNLNLHLLCIAN